MRVQQSDGVSYGTYEVVSQCIWCGVGPLDLGHLADLLGESHPAKQIMDASSEGLLGILVLGVLRSPQRHHAQHENKQGDLVKARHLSSSSRQT